MSSSIGRVYFPAEVVLIEDEHGNVTPGYRRAMISEALRGGVTHRWQDDADVDHSPEVCEVPFYWSRSPEKRPRDVHVPVFAHALAEHVLRHTRSGPWNEPPAMSSAAILLRGAGDDGAADSIQSAIALASEISEAAGRLLAATWPIGWGLTIWEDLRGPERNEGLLDTEERRQFEKLASEGGFWWEWFFETPGETQKLRPWLTPVPLDRWTRGEVCTNCGSEALPSIKRGKVILGRCDACRVPKRT